MIVLVFCFPFKTKKNFYLVIFTIGNVINGLQILEFVIESLIKYFYKNDKKTYKIYDSKSLRVLKIQTSNKINIKQQLFVI